MKKIYITILTALITFSLFAQDDHLKFKGIPIDRSLAEFVNSTMAVGFKHIVTEDVWPCMKVTLLDLGNVQYLCIQLGLSIL